MSWLLKTAMRDMMPSGAGLPGVADTGLDTFVAKIRREVPLPIWGTLMAGAAIFVLSPLFTVYLPLPSMWLPAGARDRHADRICRTAFYLPRQAVFLVKMYACMCWGQNDAVRERFAIAAYPTDPGSFRA